MISHYEAKIILECRRMDVITDDAAQAIASWWQSASVYDRGLAAFASSGKILPSLRDEVARLLRSLSDVHADAVNRLTLRSLLAYADARPVIINNDECLFSDYGHSWEAGMMHVHPEDAASTAAARARFGETVECSQCEHVYVIGQGS